MSTHPRIKFCVHVTASLLPRAALQYFSVQKPCTGVSLSVITVSQAGFYIRKQFKPNVIAFPLKSVRWLTSAIFISMRSLRNCFPPGSLNNSLIYHLLNGYYACLCTRLHSPCRRHILGCNIKPVPFYFTSFLPLYSLL